MTDRPILRLADGRAARRMPGQRDRRARPQSRGAAAQGRRLPEYEDGATLPIRVQCRHALGGGLNPDDDIRFAIVVTLEVAGTVRYDVHAEVRDALRVRVKRPRVELARRAVKDTQWRIPGTARIHGISVGALTPRGMAGSYNVPKA